jgi:CheY-like chemotaxis protein
VLPHPKVILHIDDDEDDLLFLHEALKQVAPEVILHQVSCGMIALSFLKQSKQRNALPCLIVIDLNLPVMSGKEIIREIKADVQLASIPLVIFTTASSAAYKDFLQKERIELFTKPSTNRDYLNIAQKLISYCGSD